MNDSELRFFRAKKERNISINWYLSRLMDYLVKFKIFVSTINFYKKNIIWCLSIRTLKYLH